MIGAGDKFTTLAAIDTFAAAVAVRGLFVERDEKWIVACLMHALYKKGVIRRQITRRQVPFICWYALYWRIHKEF